jgi:hypothetical protein
MRPARFDPVVRARQIVYSYVPRDHAGPYGDDEAVMAALARPHGCACSAGARRRPASTLVSQIITLVQIGLVSAIAANLGYIAAAR